MSPRQRREKATAGEPGERRAPLLSWATVRALLPALAVSALIMGAVVVGRYVEGIGVRELTSDPAAVAEVPFYTGAVTTLRGLLLAGAAAVCLTTAWVIRRWPGDIAALFGALGSFTVVLIVDDQFQVHEEILGTRLGIPQPVTFAVYGALAVALAVRFGRLLRELPDLGLLLIAVIALGAGAAVDTVGSPLPSARFQEASAEVFGIVALAFYEVRLSLHLLSRSDTSRPDAAGQSP